jgi:hypothetical protein
VVHSFQMPEPPRAPAVLYLWGQLVVGRQGGKLDAGVVEINQERALLDSAGPARVLVLRSSLMNGGAPILR